MLEIKLQSEVLLTAFRGMSQRIRKQVYIPFNIGDVCYEHAFHVSGQLVIFLLTDAFFLQEYGFVVNFKTNCLMYEIEGTINEWKLTNTYRNSWSHKRVWVTVSQKQVIVTSCTT